MAPLTLSRRTLFGGLALLAAPAIVRAATLMRVKDPGLVAGVWIGDKSAWYRWNADFPYQTVPTFQPLEYGRVSLRNETVYLHKSDPRVLEAYGVNQEFVAHFTTEGLIDPASRPPRVRRPQAAG